MMRSVSAGLALVRDRVGSEETDAIFAVRFEIPRPQIRMGISDPATHAAFGGFAEEVHFAFRKKSRDADFSDMVQLLVSDGQSLVGPAKQPRLADYLMKEEE